jgi:hypothetical protein
MTTPRAPMDERTFRKALFYAVREDFNVDATGNIFFRETRHDALIREAIVYFEQTPEQELPPMSLVEVESLAHAANRRIQTTLFDAMGAAKRRA